jgi:hypothetical protein
MLDISLWRAMLSWHIFRFQMRAWSLAIGSFSDRPTRFYRQDIGLIQRWLPSGG